MTCRPTTPGTGRWTCETCGADLGTSKGKAPPDFARCPEPARSDAREIQCIKAAWQSEWETVSEYEAVLRDFGYDFEDPDDCIDWLRGRLTALTEIGAVKEALDDAAQSLGALSCAGSRYGSELLNDMISVRGYAASRAAVARAALEGRR